MADHTIDTSIIVDLQGATANDQDVLDTIHDEIVSSYNGSMHASTGHTHGGGTGDGGPISSGVAGLSQQDMAFARLLGITIWG